MLVESAVDAAAAGNWEKALDRLEEALAANQLLRDRSTQPFHMAVLADLHRSRGAYEQSLTAAHEAAWLARGTAFQEAWAGLSLGRTLLDLNAPGEAAKHLHDGLSAARRGTQPHLELRCAANLARLYCASGDTTEALNHVRQAEDLLGRISAPPTTAFLLGTDAYVAVARVRVEMSEPARAAALLAPVRAAAEASGWLEAIAQCALWLGRSRHAEGAAAEARCLLDRALEAARNGRLPGSVWQAHAALAHVAVAEEAQQHQAAADAVITQLADRIEDRRLRARFAEGAHAELAAHATAARR